MSKAAIKSATIRTLTASLIFIGLILAISNQANANSNNSFYDERYRGWLWFEDPEEQAESDALNASNSNRHNKDTQLTPEQAKEEVEQFTKDLEAKKFMMMARPTVKNIKAYRDKEQEMWSKGTELADNWMMANLKHPELFDHIEQPVNVSAVKMKRELDREENEHEVQEFARKFNLVVFMKDGCKYCEAFAPLLSQFASTYDFNVEAISMDGNGGEVGKAGRTISKQFKIIEAPELIRKLGIEAAPTVIAVSHDSKIAFELIRGYVSIPEIEEYVRLAVKALKQEGKWHNLATKNDSSNNRRRRG